MVRFYIKERDKTVFLSPSSSSSSFSLCLAKRQTTRVSPYRVRRTDAMHRYVAWSLRPRASGGAKVVARLLRVRVFEEEGDATRTNVVVGKRPKIVSLFGFLPKTRSQKSSQTKKKRKFQQKKKERKRRKPSFLKKERMILIVADVVEKNFFTPRYFTHSLRKRSRSMNCKA